MESKLKVVHVNDVASVGTVLTESLQKIGVEAKLVKFDAPEGKSKIGSIIWRAKRATEILNEVDKKAILHIHYFPNILFFFFSRRTIFLHAHGSDIRVGRLNVLRNIFNYLACMRAKKVFYSTPDLLPYLARIGVVATFLPNPVDVHSKPSYEVDEEKAKNIFLFSALTKVKGADRSLFALKRFKKLYPECRITVFDFGEYFSEDLYSCFDVISRKKRSELSDIIASHGIILGQFKLAAIGMSELEAMAEGRTVIANFKYNDSYDKPSPVVLAESSEEIFRKVEELYGKCELLNEVGIRSRDWVLEFHDSEKIAQKLVKDYLSVSTEPKR